MPGPALRAARRWETQITWLAARSGLCICGPLKGIVWASLFPVRSDFGSLASKSFALSTNVIPPVQRTKQRPAPCQQGNGPHLHCLRQSLSPAQPGCWPKQFVNYFELPLTHLVFLI